MLFPLCHLSPPIPLCPLMGTFFSEYKLEGEGCGDPTTGMGNSLAPLYSWGFSPPHTSLLLFAHWQQIHMQSLPLIWCSPFRINTTLCVRYCKPNASVNFGFEAVSPERKRMLVLTEVENIKGGKGGNKLLTRMLSRNAVFSWLQRIVPFMCWREYHDSESITVLC